MQRATSYRKENTARDQTKSGVAIALNRASISAGMPVVVSVVPYGMSGPVSYSIMRRKDGGALEYLNNAGLQFEDTITAAGVYTYAATVTAASGEQVTAGSAPLAVT